MLQNCYKIKYKNLYVYSLKSALLIALMHLSFDIFLKFCYNINIENKNQKHIFNS